MLNKLFGKWPAAKTAVRELFYRPAWYSDNREELERLFQWSTDPWNFQTSRYEQDRFRWLLATIEKYPHNRVLEVGCAEGLFTKHLMEIAKHVVAIDVSPTALARARSRCGKVQFLQASLEEFDWHEKFDLVICSETIYYTKDVDRAIEKLKTFGRYCLVSYTVRESVNLDPYLRKLSLLEFQKHEKSYYFWKRAMTVAVWENDADTGARASTKGQTKL